MLFSDTFSIPAGATDTPLSRRGSLFEFIKAPTILEIALIQQTGAIGALLASISSGTDILLEEGPIIVAARFPVYPDDFFWRDEAAPPDRLRIATRNTTAGAIVCVTVVKFNPAF